MTTERSHGKARTTLPRSSDLKAVDSVPAPTEGRTAGGRFAPGNGISRDNAARHHVRRLLGPAANDKTISEIQSASQSLYSSLMRSMPCQAVQVRSLVALQARHTALCAYWTEYAVRVGLDSEDGIAALERASKDGARAERLAVTSLDVATKLAKTAPKAKAWWLEPLPPPPTTESSSEVGDASEGQPVASNGGEP